MMLMPTAGETARWRWLDEWSAMARLISEKCHHPGRPWHRIYHGIYDANITVNVTLSLSYSEMTFIILTKQSKNKYRNKHSTTLKISHIPSPSVRFSLIDLSLLNKLTQNKTAELSQKRPRDAPNIWVPWKVLRVLTKHPATFLEICNGLLFRSILRMYVQNLKFVALVYPFLR